jgi:uncharacterized coiled-coil protein SlyX
MFMGEIGERLEEMKDDLEKTLKRLTKIINRIKKVNDSLKEIEHLLDSIVIFQQINARRDFIIRIEIEKRPLKIVNLNQEPYICVTFPDSMINEISLVCTQYQCDLNLDGRRGFLHIRNIGEITVERLINLACNLNEKDFDALIEELERREMAYANVIETLKKVVALVKMILPS